MIRRPLRVWTVASAVMLVGGSVVPFLPAAFLTHTTGVRVIAVLAAGVLCGALVVPGRIVAVGEAG
jgi:hypothetical protein